MRDEYKYAIAGGLAGIANGFFGAGGGMFLVPLFQCWGGMEERRAFANSVAVVMVLSVVSSVVYLTREPVAFSALWPFLTGGLIGGLVSGLVFKHIPTLWLRRAFAILLLYGGVRSLFF